MAKKSVTTRLEEKQLQQVRRYLKTRSPAETVKAALDFVAEKAAREQGVRTSRGGGRLRRGQSSGVQEEFRRRYPHITIDPALFALVGIHPATPVEEDKRLIREQIARRLAE